MLDTVRNGVMSATARMYLMVMIFPPTFTQKCHRQVTGLVAPMIIKEA
jgi:hypothetical protein